MQVKKAVTEISLSPKEQWPQEGPNHRGFLGRASELLPPLCWDQDADLSIREGGCQAVRPGLAQDPTPSAWWATPYPEQAGEQGREQAQRKKWPKQSELILPTF
jgi:hypothetical protein